MTTPPYQYRPLNKERNEIRLLLTQSIEPGEDHGYEGKVIFGRIEHVDIDIYRYCAVSYVWGEPNYNCALITPEGHLPVTNNLVRAILYVCKADKTSLSPSYLPIWIDAISINQKDDVEKSWQVAEMMSRIYASSVVTACFLGPDEFIDGYIKSGVEYLHHLGDVAIEHDIFTASDRIRTCIKDILESRNSQRTLNIPSRETSPTVAHASLSDLDGSLQAVVHALIFEDETTLSTLGLPKQLHLFIFLGLIMDRDWWTRVWVIQELCMARRAVFIFGDASISATRLVAVATLLLIIKDELLRLDAIQLRGTTYGQILIFDDKLRAPALLFFSAYIGTRDSSTGLKPTLADIFETLEHRNLRLGATDPRDFIYGLLGLVQSWPDPEYCNPIVPDYSLSCEEVYIWATRYLLSLGWVKTLRAACEPKSMENLPSWVPDWSHRRRTDIGQEPQIQWVPHTQSFWMTENGRYIVSLKGYVLGHITKCETLPEYPARPQLELLAAESCRRITNWVVNADVIRRGLLNWKTFLLHHFTNKSELDSYQHRLTHMVSLLSSPQSSLHEGGVETALRFLTTKPQTDNPGGFEDVGQTISSLLTDPTKLDSTDIFNLSEDEKLEAISSWQDGKTKWSEDLNMILALPSIEISLLYYTIFLVDCKYLGASYGPIEDGDILVRLDADPTTLYILRPMEDDLFKLVTRANVPQLWHKATYEYGERGRFNLC